MTRLVHAHVTPAGQAETRDPSPSLLGDLLGELHSLVAQVAHRVFHVVAQEVQLVLDGAVGWVDGDLRRWQLEDQPTASGVDVRLSEDVGEERTVRLGIPTEHDDMTAVDHTSETRPLRRRRPPVPPVARCTHHAAGVDGSSGAGDVLGR